ncbi:short-chain dehydrogenase [Reticulibacter mediterranei]|uniref:Short-chain dehydrogenase n=1 Tax=Reticulibacter mediterranei TaxID=2778369 RepID=A0A8J3IIS0_9CHLR|nr:SDR family oxidoreductase [Reticulibacter mediterranei]GHO92172.1 short-chain dehydrogenase [Reticulibacter mediterranei]
MDTTKRRNIIITGGNSGMGRAIAEAFVRGHGHVAIIGRDQGKLQSTAQSLGSNVSWYQADVSQREQVASTIESIVEQWDHIDVLVNAAGFGGSVTTNMPLEEAEREWDALYGTNLKGSFLMIMAVAPHLVRPGGRIINISSIAAFTGGSRAGSVAYAASKSGLLGLTYGFARELSPQGITVNAIAPGFIANTGFTGAWSEERVQGIISETPIGRAGHVDDIAAATLYLASPEASFVTGEVFNVNGGWLFGR